MRRGVFALRASISRVCSPVARPSTRRRNRPVRSVRVSCPSISSVTSGRGRPSRRSTRPDTAVTPGGACNGGSVSHGDGGRPLRHPFLPLSAVGCHASFSRTSTVGARGTVVNVIVAGTSGAPRSLVGPSTVST